METREHKEPTTAYPAWDTRSPSHTKAEKFKEVDGKGDYSSPSFFFFFFFFLPSSSSPSAAIACEVITGIAATAEPTINVFRKPRRSCWTWASALSSDFN